MRIVYTRVKVYNRFEAQIAQAFNAYFLEHDITGLSYCLDFRKYQAQPCDVLVDSPNKPFYLAIECKSFTLSKTIKVLYFSKWSSTNGGHQIDRFWQFLYDTGRHGYYAIEMVTGTGRAAYLVPFNDVHALFKAKKVGITSKQIVEIGSRFGLTKRRDYDLNPVVDDPRRFLAYRNEVDRIYGRRGVFVS